MNQQEIMNVLEPIVDAELASTVLFALARVCNEKAEHIRENWQDKLTARQWDKLAKQIDQIANGTDL